MLSCLFLIVSTYIAFLIHPVLGIIWLIAQILGLADPGDYKKN